MDALGTTHVGFGIASLACGVGVFSLRKGTNAHRAIGAVYVLTMFGLNVTALLIYRVFGGFGVFHMLSLVNLALLLAGFAAVLLQRPPKRWLQWHYYLMGWSYVGLLAATATEITVRLLAWPFVVAVALPTLNRGRSGWRSGSASTAANHAAAWKQAAVHTVNEAAALAV